MYGAFIGDIVGSKYEFNNIKTKNFPLFSEGCDYTDDTIMTVAVARAILMSRARRGNSQKGFQEFLVEQMRDFGRRYPHPTGAYGGRFAAWLRRDDPRPYGSYGNGSAMRVSPCALAAVTLEEALALARASACVTHDHPEGVKGAEAVAAAIFMAKFGEGKAEIRKYIREHYYNLDFTLDSIRKTYSFDGSCQGSVPQAIVAFLESESFEDAIRNVISIGGDCDTTGAIAGSIAWVYYAVQTGRYDGWVYDRFDPSMLEIKARAAAYLPKEFIEIADEFHEACWRRAGTYGRLGGCTPILNPDETKKYGTEWGARPKARRAGASNLDCGGDGALINRSIANGKPHRLMDAWLRREGKQPRAEAIEDAKGAPSTGAHYSLDYIRAQGKRFGARFPGALCAFHDQSMHKWHLRIQLDEERLWFLSVFVREDGSFDKYSLDKESASDSHYEFEEERRIREALYVPGDENALLHEILIRYVKAHGGEALRSLIMPYVTAQFHYD